MQIFMFVFIIIIVQPNLGFAESKNSESEECQRDRRCVDVFTCRIAMKHALRGYPNLTPELLSWGVRSNPQCLQGVCCPFVVKQESERRVMSPVIKIKGVIEETIEGSITTTTITPQLTIYSPSLATESRKYRSQECRKGQRCVKKSTCQIMTKHRLRGYKRLTQELVSWELSKYPQCSQGVCCPLTGSFMESIVMEPKNGTSEAVTKETIKGSTSVTTPSTTITQKVTTPSTTMTKQLTTVPSTVPPKNKTKSSLLPPGVKSLKKHPNFHVLAGPHCGFGLYPRVSYGEEVAPGELPWTVMLNYKENGTAVFRCGGALISTRYVLTAAHCLTDPSVKIESVLLGETNLMFSKKCGSPKDLPRCTGLPQVIDIESIIPHPNFKQTSYLTGFPDDIGLVRLKWEADYSPFVSPICLSGLANHEVLKITNIHMPALSVAGWGMTEMKQDPVSNELRRVDVPPLSRSQCGKMLQRKLHECQQCAGGGKGNACRGDSGGPLMAKAWNGKESCTLLTGVISYGGYHCGFSTPAVFSNVTCYLEWILNSVTR